ncbi:MAG: ATP-binding protein [Candidatus Bathyarchaeota archaeon]|nr:ATP-binding protein [Candidatus Bathyarchaeota archaeon]
MLSERIVYPFAAIVGQSELKLALLLNAINPQIGGLLIRGPKGTGKSTSVRALADLLPEIAVVEGCKFNCSPVDPTNMCFDCLSSYQQGDVLPIEKRKMKVITLPIGATEDRVIGSLDIERAIKVGVRALEPGILAAANQNILYIDEVNLLPDHITDIILDVAASGWNIVERESISVGHPSRFILIGTMNPEEGELRPQLLDRFSLHISIHELLNKKQRVEIVKNNLWFGEAPLDFINNYQTDQKNLQQKIVKARDSLNNVTVSDQILEIVVHACIELNIDGHRPDIVTARAAKTLTAFEEKQEVTIDTLLKVAKMAIGFRTRRSGFEEPATSDEVNDAFKNAISLFESK